MICPTLQKNQMCQIVIALFIHASFSVTLNGVQNDFIRRKYLKPLSKPSFCKAPFTAQYRRMTLSDTKRILIIIKKEMQDSVGLFCQTLDPI